MMDDLNSLNIGMKAQAAGRLSSSSEVKGGTINEVLAGSPNGVEETKAPPTAPIPSRI